MTNDFNPDGYFLDDMSEEEKDQLIVELSNAYNEQLALSVGLYNTLIIAANHLDVGDTFGHRGEVMRDTSRVLKMVAALSLHHIDFDIDQSVVDSAFADIVANLGDPEES